MGHKKKLNPKKDMNAKTSHDYEMLEFAKGEEREKRLKTVRIDRSTIIYVSVDKCPIKAVE
jgi:hypothetical protein